MVKSKIAVSELSGRKIEETRIARGESREISERSWDDIEALRAFAGERGHSLLELSCGGLLGFPELYGATSPEQAKGNAAAGDWDLSPDERLALVSLRR